MRQVVDRQRLERFMRMLGSKAVAPVRVYFTGGATAILHGWRATTIDIDLKFVPERDELFRAVASLKEELQINIELAIDPPAFRQAVSEFVQRYRGMK